MSGSNLERILRTSVGVQRWQSWVKFCGLYFFIRSSELGVPPPGITATTTPDSNPLPMEKLAQELIDKIIDDVDYNDLFACSLVQTRWVEPTHRRLWGSGYCSFVSKAGLQVWGPSLLLNHSTVPSRIHTLTLASTAVRGWAIYFDSVDVVFPNLRSLVIINPASGIPHYFPVLKKHFGEALESLTLCDINFIANELHSILGSIPNLRDLNISRSSLVQSPDVPPTFESPPADLQAQGKLSLTGIETHRALIPLFAKLPGVQYRSLYFSSAFQLDVGKVQQLMSACSSALETLEIRGGVFSLRFRSSHL